MRVEVATCAQDIRKPSFVPDRMAVQFTTDNTGRPADHRATRGWSTATRQQDRTRIGSVLSVLSVARLNLTDYSDGRVIRGTAYYQTRSSVDSRMILVR